MFFLVQNRLNKPVPAVSINKSTNNITATNDEEFCGIKTVQNTIPRQYILHSLKIPGKELSSMSSSPYMLQPNDRKPMSRSRPVNQIK
jgi:hypothetical protein